jgi:hypothetical protein
MEDRRQKLIFHLNAHGIYFDFKEKLKKALVGVIREKFPLLVEQQQRVTSGAIKGQGNSGTLEPNAKTALYAPLYTYLMEEVIKQHQHKQE